MSINLRFNLELEAFTKLENGLTPLYVRVVLKSEMIVFSFKCECI